ncbi:hypothetical protein GCM10007304_09270 [Rhodococcoides trifolii]|uniref:DUF559 domain-containing protein n=1 Tax=Rhodococcoides trifolii TaxID=908250 RepID=A0A917CUR6_9NOCA|nr:DUF559 domain-containing protein [Rhodococcus trifolii]GGF97429.1 hypothetical protein GCM10007304_09270 [Rhodococcus trifolii]
MTAVDFDAPPWWRRLPLDRVVRLDGPSFRDLAESVDPLPADAPAPLFFALTAGTASQMAAAVVDALEQAAVDLVPIWLPGYSDDDRSNLARDSARVRAHDVASTSNLFGPYLAHLVDARMDERAPRGDAFARETRATEAGRVIAAAHGRSTTVLIVDVPADADRDAVSAMAEWLCSNSIGVWLIGADEVDRFPRVRVDAPRAPADVVTIVDRFRPMSFPPVEGRPHAASAAEDTLCRLLSAREWAAGRGHNRTLKLTELSPPFTVDVLWADAKVVVEIDGPEHRARGKFSADRSRDNALQTHGYMVLRFTNDDVHADHERVLATIHQAVTQRSKGAHT